MLTSMYTNVHHRAKHSKKNISTHTKKYPNASIDLPLGYHVAGGKSEFLFDHLHPLHRGMTVRCQTIEIHAARQTGTV